MKYCAEWFCDKTLNQYPHALEAEKKLLAERDELQQEGYWPDWCAFPMAATYAVLTMGDPNPQTAVLRVIQQGPDALPALTAALLWRKSKVAYRFDTILQHELEQQPLDDAIPSEVFNALPHPCVFIEAPMGIENGQVSRGFFVWQEFDVHHKWRELRLLFLTTRNKTVSYPVVLKDVTLSKSEALIQESARQRAGLYSFVSAPESAFPKDIDTVNAQTIRAAISLALYLCSANADISPPNAPASHPGPANPPSQKAGSKTVCHQVGLRVGQAFRRYYQHASPASGDAAHKSRHVTPHARRAHWHHYWVGPKSQPDSRKLILKWIAPVLVGLADDGLATSIQTVK